MKRKLSITVLGAAAALAIAVSVGGAAPQPGFRAGTWVGSGVQKGVFAVVPGDPTPVDGTAQFTLTVSKGNVASGKLILKSQMELDYMGMRGGIVAVADAKLTGTGSDIRWSGPLHMSGEISDGKLTMPFSLTKPIGGRLLISRSTCTLVTGGTDSKLSFHWRAIPKKGTPRPKC